MSIYTDHIKTHEVFPNNWARDSINGYIYPSTLTDKVGIGTATPATELDVNGTGTFNQIIDSGLTASKGVYTNASKQLVSTPPTNGVLGHWSRDSATNIITTGIANDLVTLDGKLTVNAATALNDTATIIKAFAPDTYARQTGDSIVGYTFMGNQNFDYGSRIRGLSFGVFSMFSGAVGSPNLDAIGTDNFGGGIFFGALNLRSGIAFRGQGLSVAVGNATMAKFSCAFYSLDDEALGSGSNPSQFGYYGEKPSRGTKNYQEYLYGNGDGTGIWLGGNYVLAALMDADSDSIFSANAGGTSTNGWTGTNWLTTVDAVNGNYFQHTTGSTANATLLSTRLVTGSLTAGNTYEISYEVINRTAGSVTPKLGAVSGTTRSANGIYRENIIITADDVSVLFTPTSDFDGAIKAVYIDKMNGFQHSRIYSPSNSQLNLAIDTDGTETDKVEITTDTVKINIGLILPYVAKTATYTILTSDYTIDCTANTFTVTLPTAVGITGQIFNIKNSGTGVITVDGNGTETIDGNLTEQIPAGESRKVQSTGTNYILI